MGKRIFQWHEYANGKIFTSSSMAEKALERSIWQDGRSRKRNWNTEELRKRLNKQSYTVPPFRHSGDA